MMTVVPSVVGQISLGRRRCQRLRHAGPRRAAGGTGLLSRTSATSARSKRVELPFVTSVPPSDYAELLALDLEQTEEVPPEHYPSWPLSDLGSGGRSPVASQRESVHLSMIRSLCYISSGGLPLTVATHPVPNTKAVLSREVRRIRHIPVGVAHKNRKVRLLVAGADVPVVTEDGKLLRAFSLDPTRCYQPLGGRWPVHNVLQQASTMS